MRLSTYLMGLLAGVVILPSVVMADAGGLPQCRIERDAALADLAVAEANLSVCEALLADSQGETSACADQVAVLQDQVSALSAQVDDLTNALSDCLANSGKLPGDGVTGTPHQYTDTGNTVLDEVTKLEWAKKTLDGGLLDRDNFRTYAGALAWIDELNAADFEGGASKPWRLPNRVEAITIMTHGQGHPCIDGVFGDVTLGVPAFMWTSTPNPINADSGYVVDYRACGMSASQRSNSLRVMAVR